MDLIKLLENNAITIPQKPAIYFKEKTINFSELRDMVFRFACVLKDLGIKRGDKVGIYLPSCPEYIISYLAIWYLGATAVPMDFMLTEDELVSCLGHSDTVLLIARPKPTLALDSLKARCPGLTNIILTGENNDAYLSFEKLISNAVINITLREIKPNDYSIIFYTSGTTGKPKGVQISYAQLGAPPMAMQFFVDLKESDITVCALPFSHLGGLIYIQNCIVYGMSVILMERFMPLEFLKIIQNHKITCFWIVPSMYYAFLQLKEFESFDLSSLRWIVTFGASNSPDALRRFHQYCPDAHLLNGWGLTETNAPTTVIPMGSKNIESVGRPAPWVEVKIFDDEERQLESGNIGEIVVGGWVVTDGYYKDKEATETAIKGGWFHTGDLGRFDAEGNLYIVGRKKEMIKVGGEIVFEPEVESVIHRHPDVAEVAVVGIPDKLRGEVPKAFIAVKQEASISEEDLRYFCRKHLANFKIPHYFEFMPSLPKNRTGKIDKELLRRR